MKIGLRIPGTARQLPFAVFCQWCVDNGFEAVDIGETTPEIVQTARDAGLVIGTADLPGTRDLLSTKKSKQKAGASSSNSRYRSRRRQRRSYHVLRLCTGKCEPR